MSRFSTNTFFVKPRSRIALRLARRTGFESELRELGVVARVLQRVDGGGQAIHLQTIRIVGVAVVQRHHQVLPVLLLRVVRDQLLEHALTASVVVRLVARALHEQERLLLRPGARLDLAVDVALDELRGALVVALLVVRLTDVHVGLVVREAFLRSLVAELR